jgi:hypothetical protein
MIPLDEKQKEAVAKGIKAKTLMLWWKVGEGKTRIALALAEHFCSGRQTPVVLAILRRKAFWDLKNEIHKVGLDWHVFEFEEVATLKQSEREHILSETKVQVWMISADSLHKFTKEFYQYVKFIFIDEMWLFGNPKSKRSQTVQRIVRSLRTPSIGASGSIQSNSDNTTIWGQTCTFGISDKIATNLTEFRRLYQICSITEMGQRQFLKRQNRPGSVKKIIAKIEPYTHVHFPKSSNKITIKDTLLPITKEQETEIKNLKKDWMYETKEGEVIEIRYALEMLHKFRQISNGYISDREGNFRSIPTNKTTATKQWADELLDSKQQMLIWCAFRYDVKMLCELFKGKAIPFTGEAPFDVAKFQTGKYPVVIGTSASGSSTNVFKDIAYALYYSSDYKATILQQSMGRTDRKDSSHNLPNKTRGKQLPLRNLASDLPNGSGCFYEFLSVEGTPDLDILANARQDQSNEQTMINIFTKWLNQN